MFKVHLRRKQLTDPSRLSLYLDFSRNVWHEARNKWTRREFLDLHIYSKPRTNLEKKHNRETLELAETKRSETLLAIQKGTYGLKTDEDKAIDFLAFYRDRMATRKGSNLKQWQNAYNHFADFTKGKCLASDITKNTLLDFKDHLDKQALSKNTKYQYFSKIKTAVHEAEDRGIVPRIEVKNFGTTKAQRPFLTDEQIAKLRKTKFQKNNVFRRAALFSIVTSLRWSDVILLRYEWMQFDGESHLIDFKQKKPNRPDILYLGKDALALCDHEEGKTGRIFPLRYTDKNLLVRELLDSAGVPLIRGVGFHIFRHTFAMRMLNRGERIEVISAMMGHSDIKTTQIYARLHAELKREAAHRVTLE